MLPFRLFLSLALVLVLAYTGVVISRHGMDFPAVFVDDIARFGWAGQFNLDFTFLLLLAALWLAWRHRFSAGGIALASLFLVTGTPFLCVYLMTESIRSGGDVRAMLLGSRQHDR